MYAEKTSAIRCPPTYLLLNQNNAISLIISTIDQIILTLDAVNENDNGRMTACEEVNRYVSVLMTSLMSQYTLLAHAPKHGDNFLADYQRILAVSTYHSTYGIGLCQLKSISDTRNHGPAIGRREFS